MTSPVVVATDFSPSARVAMGHAARIAAARSAPLHVVLAVDSDPVTLMVSAGSSNREEIESRLIQHGSGLLDREVSDAGVEVPASNRHVKIGRPGRVIVDECERLGAGLLVLGYHGGSAKYDRGPGSVAQRCVRHAPCDVLLTRRDRPEAFKRVVAGVDFSKATRATVARAAEMAGPGGELVLLHAYSDPFESLGYMGMGLGVEPIPLGTYAAALQADLEKMGAGLGASVGTVRTEVFLDSYPGRAIADWCNEHGADLTAVGTRGKPGVRYWLLGSTAELVLRETRSAVLAVRQHDEAV